jgi:hypothetical protein
VLPFAGNLIRGHVTKGMKFTEVQILAEQAGKAARLLAPRASSRSSQITATNNTRPGPWVAASSESSQCDPEMYQNRSARFPEAVIASAEFGAIPFDTGSNNSTPSSVSIPSRRWSSVAGPPVAEPAYAADLRNSSCYLYFDPGYFVLDCPLVGPEARRIAQTQRERKFTA